MKVSQTLGFLMLGRKHGFVWSGAWKNSHLFERPKTSIGGAKVSLS